MLTVMGSMNRERQAWKQNDVIKRIDPGSRCWWPRLDCQKGTRQTQEMFKRAKSLKTSSWGW